jgi:hypothetical protein
MIQSKRLKRPLMKCLETNSQQPRFCEARRRKTMESLDTIEYRGFNINIHPDYDAGDYCNPRECYNVGTMACWHPRYTLGDKQISDMDEFKQELALEACPRLENLIDCWENGVGWETYQDFDKSDAMIEKAVNAVLDRFYIILPLYLYDHSGITMNTSGFSCPWDSGQVGIIYATTEQCKKEWPIDNWHERAVRCLRAEVKEYDYFISGEIYGYTVEPKDTNKGIECDDSCWGFLGYEYAMETMVSEAKASIDYAIKDYREKTVAHAISERNRKRGVDALINCCYAL